MAARLNKRHQDMVREKIRASFLINRLQDHVEGKVELNSTQVQSAKILLDKALSNAQTDVNLTGDVSINWPEPRNALDV